MAAELFREFVDVVFEGVQAKAAAALEVDASLVSRICKGERGVTPALAARVEEVSEGRYRKEALIWPDACDNDSDLKTDS